VLAGFVAAAMVLLPSAARAKVETSPEPARPQAAASNTNPNEGFMGTWKDISGKIAVMAEDFPEDKYDFKPNPEVRTFAEQMLHVTGAVYYFKAILEGHKPGDEPKRADFKNKAEIVAFAKKAIAEGTALLEKADFSKAIERPKPQGNQKPRPPINPYRFWSDFCEHAGEHYGQMVVYYRVNGLVPPDSRPKK
jgi:hypothetical protein